MSKILTQKRVLVCSFIALTAGFCGGYIGGQITMSLNSQKCQRHVWGVKQACEFVETPKAMWSGGTTGLWTATILGAFIGGKVTHKSKK